MAIGSPFTVLGLCPDPLRGLLDTQIYEIVQSQFRTLSKYHHPDTGGTAGRFQELSWAANQLDLRVSPDTFMYWKEQFFKKRRDALEDVNQRLVASAKQIASMEQARDEHIRALTHPYEFGLSVPLARNIRIMISDVMAFSFRARLADNARKQVSVRNASSPLLNLDIDSMGRVMVTPLEKVFFTDFSELNGIHRHWVEAGTRPNRRFYWRPEGNPKLLRGVRLVGSLDAAAMRPPKGKHVPVYSLLEGPVDERTYEAVKFGFSQEEFSILLPFFRSFLGYGDHVIGCTIVDNQLRYLVLGMMRHWVKTGKREKRDESVSCSTGTESGAQEGVGADDASAIV